MSDEKIKNFNLEQIFTRKDYKELKQAIEKREEYEFRYAKAGTYLPHPSTGIYFKVDGRKCDNGIWKDNYLYGFDTWRNNSGLGMPFDPVDKVLSYEELINLIYQGLYIAPPRQKQLSLLDFEM